MVYISSRAVDILNIFSDSKRLKKEIEQLKEIVVSQAGEIELLKKKTNSVW